MCRQAHRGMCTPGRFQASACHRPPTPTSAAPLQPSALLQAKQRVIEFVGADEAAGFGNLGAPSHRLNLLSYRAENTDAVQGWCGAVARAFGAEAHVVARSGAGVVANSWLAPSRDNMGELYPRLCASDPASKSALAHVDLVVVYLGANDWDKEWKRSEAEFVAGLTALLCDIRGRHATAPVLVLGPGAAAAPYCGSVAEQGRFAADLARCVARAVAAAGDAGAQMRAAVVEPEPPIDHKAKGDWGTMGGWSAQAHGKWARGVVAVIQRLMHWEPG